MSPRPQDIQSAELFRLMAQRGLLLLELAKIKKQIIALTTKKP